MKHFDISISRRRGFTITEVLIAAVINMVVCVGALSIFIAAAKVQRDVYNHATVDAEARKVENWLVSDIRSAMTVEPSYYFGGKTYTSDENTLILRLPSVDQEGRPVNLQNDPAATTSDFIVYYHTEDGTMRRLLVRHNSSWRDGRNERIEDRALSQSSNAGLVHRSAFSVAPGVLGPVVVHYEFKSSRMKNNGTEEAYTVSSAGSVYLRNRPLTPSVT